MEKITEFNPDWVLPPGALIEEALEERGWTKADFAREAGLPSEQAGQLISGKAAITEPIAEILSRVIGSTARFWLASETRYRSELMRLGKVGKLKRVVSRPIHAQQGGQI